MLPEGCGILYISVGAALSGGCSAWPGTLPIGGKLLQVEPNSEAKVSENVYKLDTVFDGSFGTRSVYETTTQHLIRQARGRGGSYSLVARLRIALVLGQRDVRCSSGSADGSKQWKGWAEGTFRWPGCRPLLDGGQGPCPPKRCGLLMWCERFCKGSERRPCRWWRASTLRCLRTVGGARQGDCVFEAQLLCMLSTCHLIFGPIFRRGRRH